MSPKGDVVFQSNNNCTFIGKCFQMNPVRCLERKKQVFLPVIVAAVEPLILVRFRGVRGGGSSLL